MLLHFLFVALFPAIALSQNVDNGTTIPSARLTVNKTGLYPVSAQVAMRVISSAPTSYVPETTTNVIFHSGSTLVNYFRLSYLDHSEESITDAGAGGSYYHTKRIEGDIHLSAGMNVRVNRDLRAEITPVDVICDVFLKGYLIAD